MRVLRLLMLAAVATAALFAPAPAFADDPLPRRPWLGVRFDEKAAGAPVVAEVLPNGTGLGLGLKAGDRIVKVGNVETSTGAAVAAAVSALRSGEDVVVQYERAGVRGEARAALVARPLFTSPVFDVAYGAATVRPGLRVRTILTKPRGEGPFPALLVVQNPSPVSVDAPLDHPAPVVRLVDGLTRAGFAVMRVDRPGVGDSEGGPYADVDFDGEVAAFSAALAALATTPGVDPGALFLFGHDAGGLIAALASRRVPVKGIVAASSPGTTWVEHYVGMARRELTLRGNPAPKVDAEVRAVMGWVSAVWLEGRDPAAAATAFPDARGPMGDGPVHQGKGLAYWRQLARTNVAEAWQGVAGDVLALHGDADWSVPAESSRVIADVVNAARPGKGTYLSLPDTDHGFFRRASPEESFRLAREPNAPVNDSFLPVVRDWLRGRVGR